MDKKVLLGLLFTLFLVIFVPVYWIREPSRQERAQARQREQAAERGAETYVALCAGCHGPQGQGLIGKALRNSPLGEPELVKIIARGRPAQPVPMPALAQEEGGPLRPHQIRDLATFLRHWDDALMDRARKKHEMAAPPKTPAPAPAPAAAPTAPTATPSPLPSPAPAVPTPQPTAAPTAEMAAQGRQLYALLGCSACHGPGGEGTAIGPGLAGFTREQIVRQVRTPRTPRMPSYPPDRLSEADLEKVVAFLLTLK